MDTAKEARQSPAWPRAARYGTEFLIVFVGVWLSLLAENWRQDRVDSSTARASLARMAQDLESDLADLQLNLQRAEAGVDHGRWLLARGPTAATPTDSVARALSAVQFCSVFIENTGEYEALRNSGRLGIVADADLRRRIVALYESRVFIRSLHTTDCQIKDVVFKLMAPHIVAAEPPYASRVGQMASDGLPDSSRPRVVSVPGRSRLLANPAFVSHLTELITYSAFLTERIRDQLRETGGLRDALLTRSQ